MAATNRRGWRSRAERAAVHVIGIALGAWVVMLLWGLSADLHDDPSLAHSYWVALLSVVAFWVLLSSLRVLWRRLRKRGDR